MFVRMPLGLILLALLCFLAAPYADAAEMTGLRIESGTHADRVSVRLSDKVKYRLFRVEVPPSRVALDLENTHGHGVSMPRDYKGTLVKGVRFGRFNEDTGRLVFDLATDVQPENIRLIGSQSAGGYWLEFDLPYRVAASPMTVKTKHHHSVPKTKKDSKPVIVIDAGHGGQDPGTEGYSGAEEKDFTLRYALALEQGLLKTGRYKVALTRRDDTYLLLRERVKRARAAHGDLFISIHADSASSESARGLSIYTISEKASDKESEALADQENRADIIGGMDLSGASDDVAGILIDLAERETRAKSTEFADLAVRYLGHEVGLLSNTHRFAGFAVLKAPDIPSVLVELGFLTNPKEETQLKNRAYQQKIVKGMTEAVDDYFGHKK